MLIAYMIQFIMISFVNVSQAMKEMVCTKGAYFWFIFIFICLDLKTLKFYFSCFPIGEGPVGLSLVYAQGVSLHKISFRNNEDNLQPYKNRIVYIPCN